MGPRQTTVPSAHMRPRPPTPDSALIVEGWLRATPSRNNTPVVRIDLVARAGFVAFGFGPCTAM